jgi:CDK-activating kinase assembly factor MAT1
MGCEVMLSRKNFKDQSREDTLYLLDAEKRKEVISVMNKQQSDFDSLEDFDNYLLEIEQKIDTLIQGTQEDKIKV